MALASKVLPAGGAGHGVARLRQVGDGVIRVLLQLRRFACEGVQGTNVAAVDDRLVGAQGAGRDAVGGAVGLAGVICAQGGPVVVCPVIGVFADVLLQNADAVGLL